MACITGSVTNVSNGINASVVNLGGVLTAYQQGYEHAKVSVNNLNPLIYATTNRVGEEMTADTSRLGDRLTGTVSIICSLADFVAILKVSPDEVQWITDDMGVYFEVESNVEWIVLTS